MAGRNKIDLGETIQSIVEDAVSSREFESLNNSIRDTIDAVFAELNIDSGKTGRTSYGAGDWAVGRRDSAYSYDRKGSEKWSQGRRPSGGSYSSRPSYSQGKTAEPAEKKEAEPKLYAENPPGSISGPLMTAIGGGLSGIFGFFTILLGLMTIFMEDFAAPGAISTFVMLAGLVPSVLLFLKGRKTNGRVKRFRSYINTLAGRTFCRIKELAAAVGKDEKFVADDLREMIEKNFFTNGHLDMQGTTLMLDDESYRQYLSANEAYLKREEEQAKNKRQSRKKAESPKSEEKKESIFGTITSEDPALIQAVKDGEHYIRKIREANDAIPGEEISQKLDRLEMLMRKIFLVLQQKPDQLPKLRKFMNYYMPTTDKLVQTYRELDAQPVEGENITKAKKDIEETIDTINDAYEKLLDNFFAEAALDVSTDITVLQNLMAQEGLTNTPFEMKSY